MLLDVILLICLVLLVLLVGLWNLSLNDVIPCLLNVGMLKFVLSNLGGNLLLLSLVCYFLEGLLIFLLLGLVGRGVKVGVELKGNDAPSIDSCKGHRASGLSVTNHLPSYSHSYGR